MNKTKHHIFKLILLLIINCVVSQILYSQEERKIYIEPKYHYGRLIIHSEKVRPLKKGNINIYEINAVFKTTGKQKWTQYYNYPDLGLGYNFTSWKNPEMIGTAHTLNSFIRLPIIKTNLFKLNHHFGIGPCIFTKTYDEALNPLNLSIGSYLNLYLHIGLESQFNISNNFKINAGYGINHYSIGNLVQPNVGLNVDAAYFSLQYAFKKSQMKFIKDQINKKQKHHEFWAYVGPGFKEIEIDLDTNAWKTVQPDPGHKYFTTTASINYAYQFNYKQKVGIGLEYFYDKSLHKRLVVQGVDDILPQYYFRPGANISHELLFSDFSFVTQIGYYLYSKSTRFGRVYYRVAFKYHFSERWFSILALKAHLPAIADFTEWGIGYRFRK